MRYDLARQSISSVKGQVINIEYNSDKTCFVGRNNSGKSTIVETLCWAMTGTPLYGDKPSIITNGDVSAMTTLTFMTEGGVEKSLNRSIKRTSTGTSGSVRMNHVKATEEQVAEFFHVSGKTLKSVIFPQYFFGLSTSDQQKTLMGTDDTDWDKCLKEVEKELEEYSAQMEEYSSKFRTYNNIISYFKDFDIEVKKKHFGNVSKFLKAKASEIFAAYPPDMEMLSALTQYAEIGSHETLESEMEVLENLLDDISIFVSKADARKSDIIQKMNDHMTACKYELEKYGIHMDMEDKKGIFKATGFSYKGLPLAACSGKEKIEACIAISNYITSEIGINLPMVLDGCESIVGDELMDAMLPEDRQAILFYAADCSLGMDNGDGKTMTEIHTGTVVPRTPLFRVRSVNIVEEMG